NAGEEAIAFVLREDLRAVVAEQEFNEIFRCKIIIEAAEVIVIGPGGIAAGRTLIGRRCASHVDLWYGGAHEILAVGKDIGMRPILLFGADHRGHMMVAAEDPVVTKPDVRQGRRFFDGTVTERWH